MSALFTITATAYLGGVSRMEGSMTLFEVIRGAMIFEAAHRAVNRHIEHVYPELSAEDHLLIARAECMRYFYKQDHAALQACADIIAEELGIGKGEAN